MKYERENVYCPVCRKEGIIGERKQDEWFEGACGACGVTYFYKPFEQAPYKNKPLERKSKAKCGCWCGR